MSGSTPGRQRTRSASLRAEAERHADQVSSRGTIAWGSAVRAHVLHAMGKSGGPTPAGAPPLHPAEDTAESESG